ncbi:MAG: cytochrome c3 family protein [Gemmatimonadetes bacterium]|nr:cytochrome c3 family protein [Gemmatimonadota bacterium]
MITSLLYALTQGPAVLVGGPLALAAAWLSWSHRVALGAWVRRARGAHELALCGVIGFAAFPAPQDTATFQHARHTSVECVECHGTGERHGKLKFGGPEGCRSCHHGVTQPSTCAACHATAPKARDVNVTIHVTGRKTSPTRALRFRHEQHAKLDCKSCHQPDVDRTVEKNCVSCHADHHGPARDCTSCHADARKGHDLTAHDDCATCHKGKGLPALTFTRALCLTCHAAQRNHEPGGDCAACHAVASHGAAGGRN